MISIPISFRRYGKAVCHLRMGPVQLAPHLPAQILIQPVRIYFCANGGVPLSPFRRQSRLTLYRISSSCKDGLKALALFHDKTQIMAVLCCQVRIIPNIFLHPAFCAHPLTLDISQRVKNREIKIYGRQTQPFTQSAFCHFILHGIARVNLRQTANSAVSVINVIFDLSAVPGNLQHPFHISYRNRNLIVLINSLIYSMFMPLHTAMPRNAG